MLCHWLWAGRSSRRLLTVARDPWVSQACRCLHGGRAPGISMCGCFTPCATPEPWVGVPGVSFLCCLPCLPAPEGPGPLASVFNKMPHAAPQSPRGLSIPISTCAVLVCSEADPDPFRPPLPSPQPLTSSLRGAFSGLQSRWSWKGLESSCLPVSQAPVSLSPETRAERKCMSQPPRSGLTLRSRVAGEATPLRPFPDHLEQGRGVSAVPWQGCQRSLQEPRGPSPPHPTLMPRVTLATWWRPNPRCLSFFPPHPPPGFD